MKLLVVAFLVTASAQDPHGPFLTNVVCEDSTSWTYNAGSKGYKGCAHVAEKTDPRCTRVSDDGVSASLACPVTCGLCVPPAPTPRPVGLSPRPTASPNDRFCAQFDRGTCLDIECCQYTYTPEGCFYKSGTCFLPEPTYDPTYYPTYMPSEIPTPRPVLNPVPTTSTTTFKPTAKPTLPEPTALQCTEDLPGAVVADKYNCAWIRKNPAERCDLGLAPTHCCATCGPCPGACPGECTEDQPGVVIPGSNYNCAWVHINPLERCGPGDSLELCCETCEGATDPPLAPPATEPCDDVAGWRYKARNCDAAVGATSPFGPTALTCAVKGSDYPYLAAYQGCCACGGGFDPTSPGAATRAALYAYVGVGPKDETAYALDKLVALFGVSMVALGLAAAARRVRRVKRAAAAKAPSELEGLLASEAGSYASTRD